MNWVGHRLRHNALVRLYSRAWSSSTEEMTEACRQLLAQRATLGEGKVAMPERTFNHAIHLRHALQQGCAPSRREHIDFGALRVQAHEQWLRQDGVADPGGGDDQDS